MIATKVDRVYSIAMPADVREVLHAAEVTVDLGLSLHTTPLECIGLHSCALGLGLELGLCTPHRSSSLGCTAVRRGRRQGSLCLV